MRDKLPTILTCIITISFLNLAAGMVPSSSEVNNTMSIRGLRGSVALSHELRYSNQHLDNITYTHTRR